MFLPGRASASEGLEGGLTTVLGVLQLTCGVGLWRLKPYGRTILLVLSVFFLLAFPVGTLIAGLILVYLNKPGASTLFAGQSPSELTPDQLAQVATFSQGSRAKTALVALLLVVAIVGPIIILAAIAVPGLMRARMAGNETTAISGLATIATAQQEYAASCGNGAFAASLTDLAGGLGAQSFSPVGSPARDLATLAGGTRTGFTFVLRPAARAAAGPLDCKGKSTVSAWYAAATPATFGTTGTRSFAVNAGNTIYQVTAAAAPTEPFGPPAVPIR